MSRNLHALTPPISILMGQRLMGANHHIQIAQTMSMICKVKSFGGLERYTIKVFQPVTGSLYGQLRISCFLHASFFSLSMCSLFKLLELMYARRWLDQSLTENSRVCEGGNYRGMLSACGKFLLCAQYVIFFVPLNHLRRRYLSLSRSREALRFRRLNVTPSAAESITRFTLDCEDRKLSQD